jgi:TRAP-type C4-dicarboxylate transport system substrate-binding protein
MSKRDRFVVALAALVFCGFAVGSHAQQVLRLGSIVAPASVQAQAMDRFTDNVKKKNVGIEIRTFHGSQLGGGPEQVRNVQLGVQDMFMDGMVFWSDYSDDMRIAETPFSFASREHFEKWVQSASFNRIQDDIIAKGNQRLINLGVMWRRGPFRVLVAKKPVLNLDDFSNLRLRVWQSEVATRFYGKPGLGATPVVLPLGDVYVGMLQGVVEGLTLPFDLVQPMKFHEVGSHIMLWDEFWQVLPMSISEKKWQTLTDAQRRAITESVDEAGKWYNDQLAQSVVQWKADLVKAGATLHDVNRAPFVQRIAERNRQWQKENYWRPGLIDEIEKLR